MHSYRLIVFLYLLTSAATVSSQDYYLRDDVYVDYIKSIQFTRSGAPLSLPHYDLDGNASLLLSFDDLDNYDKTYRYELKYCTKDWELSDLDEIQYLDGFQMEEILNAEASEGRYSDFINYQLEIPNDLIRPTRSGNYILIIYEDDGDPFPVLTRRFMVVEPISNINIDFKRPFQVDKIRTHQELDVTLNLRDLRISEPLSEISITVMQNGRWDNMITDLNPQYILGSQLKFNLPDLITFEGIKEFRSFDIRSLRFTSVGVNSIDLHRNGSDVLLNLQESRNDRSYLFFPDINGNFVIQKSQIALPQLNTDNTEIISNTLIGGSSADSRNLDCQYASVIFSLDMPQLYEGDVYMIGKFSDWLPRAEYRLDYDDRRQIYTGESLFKQGYYDYMFAVSKNDGILDLIPTEGSWYATENDYTVLVYLSEFGAISDRLIGINTASSLYNLR